MRVLNVGGNNKAIQIPKFYDGWEYHLLDIDPKGSPDICCDAVLLKDRLEHKGRYDSVYCSHNLEHYYRHKVRDVLAGFLMVLNDEGFCYIRVPHIMNVLRRVVAYNMELTDTLYLLLDGSPIMPHDVIFGWGRQIRESGVEFFAHKCAFTPKMLQNELNEAGFPYTYVGEADLELVCIASRQIISDDMLNKIINMKNRKDRD